MQAEDSVSQRALKDVFANTLKDVFVVAVSDAHQKTNIGTLETLSGY